MTQYIPADHYWIIDGDDGRVFSSARRAFVAPDDGEFATWREGTGWQAQPIASEVALWGVLSDQAPQCLPDDRKPKRKVPKSLILSRITDAQLEAAMSLMTLRQQERWRAPDQPAVYFDDPETVAVLTAVGADAVTVLGI